MAGLLASAAYDPGTAVSFSTSTTSSLAAIDTTNLRVTFTAPGSGNVCVRARATTSGAATYPTILLGVLEGSTSMARSATMGTPFAAGATYSLAQEMYVPVTGLGAGSHTWDLSYATQVAVSGSHIIAGGPNDATGADAWGAITFDVFDPGSNFLGAVLYDPATQASKSTTALAALTAFDTTNARITFTAPASGNVFWRIRCPWTGASATYPQVMLGILESTTVVARQISCRGQTATALSTTHFMQDASGVVTGVSAGSHSWDAAYAVQVVSSAGGGLKYGGPNNASGNNAVGGLMFELWAAS